MRIYELLRLVDGVLVYEPKNGVRVERSNVIGVLISVNIAWQPLHDSEWMIEIPIGAGKKRQLVRMTIEKFLSGNEYDQSTASPVCFTDIASVAERIGTKIDRSTSDSLWLYRDAIYWSERVPGPSEREEVILLIKAAHFRREERLRKLRTEVAMRESEENVLKPDEAADPYA